MEIGTTMGNSISSSGKASSQTTTAPVLTNDRSSFES